MLQRRNFLLRTGLLAAGVAPYSLLAAEQPNEPRENLPDGSAAKGMITPETDQAIEKGLAHLFQRRHRDGSFDTYDYAGNVAVTSLSALAFMCAGHQPNRGAYGRAVTDALRFVLSQENRDPDHRHPGYLHNPNATPHGPMYGHGFATLFLAETSGMIHDAALRKEVHAKLRRAVTLILDSQNREGG